MRKQPALLNLIVRMWDVDDQAFHVGPHVLRLELEDIYFLTGLSKRGVPLILNSPRPFEYSTEDYIDTFCREGTRKVSDKIPIKNVEDRCLQNILFTIWKLSSSTGSHVALKSKMALGIKCLELKIFNWSLAVLVNLKDQLSCCRNGKKKLFGCGSILVSFFLTGSSYCDLTWFYHLLLPLNREWNDGLVSCPVWKWVGEMSSPTMMVSSRGGKCKCRL